MGRSQRTDDGAFSYRVMNRWQLQGAIGRPGLLCIEGWLSAFARHTLTLVVRKSCIVVRDVANVFMDL